jgi:alpha-glucuronidase
MQTAKLCDRRPRWLRFQFGKHRAAISRLRRRNKLHRLWIAIGALLSTVLLATASAETGAEAWLRYHALDPQAAQAFDSLPDTIVVAGDSAVLKTAQQEFIRGARGMLGRTLRVQPGLPSEKSIVLGTLDSLQKLEPALKPPTGLAQDGYWLTHAAIHGVECLVVAAVSDRGVLYGVFAVLSKIARGESLAAVNEVQQPYLPLRWVNQWDNLDGRIERGYAGPSIFFENGNVRQDLKRASEYARLLASVGINGCTINNVNADPRLLSRDFLPQLARIADVFRPWGVQLALAVDLSTPKALGELDTFDPVDPRVADWWRRKMDEVYRQIPEFGGVVMKADSEGRPGPASYGRTPADAANVLARALRGHGGVVFYRAFVYNHHLDWQDLKNDRAKAAYDIFHPLDGQFDDNVIVQIKHGPIDFQVREPVSPLLGGLRRTNEALELQITQEYTGQQRHLCFLVPMWKEVLDFDLHATDQGTPVRDLVAGTVFHRPLGGMVGVANVGMDPNWLGNPLAMANLYGFGRLAWNPLLDARAIVEEWTRLTFGNDPVVVQTITQMQLLSWPTYESYTGPLGVGTLTNILGSHYGPGPESSERNGWGQWHRADHEGIGMDRTIATGTGFLGQYSPPVQSLYESLAKCPDNLLLFFHHVPYTHVLHAGKTVVQFMYDSHYEGAQQAQQFVTQWRNVRGRIDDERYQQILGRLEYQAGHAVVWRDAICNWLARLSGIPDAKGRVGNHPGRIEAENMHLQGYVPVDVTPWEAASGGKGVQCVSPVHPCTAGFSFQGTAGTYRLDIQYFDTNNGVSRFRVLVDGKQVDAWLADATLPTTQPDADSSTRRSITKVPLRPGDEIRIEGVPDGGEPAALDYVEISPWAE